MNKKFAATLSGGAALLIALSGCSGSDSGDAKNAELDAWAKKVCDQVQLQLTKITAANTSLQQQTSATSKPADVQKADSAAFQSISDAYRTLSSGVTEAAAPPVDGTDQDRQAAASNQRRAVQELNATSTAYASLKKTVDALDSTDQAKFADGLKTVGEKLNELTKTADLGIRRIQSGKASPATKKQPGCRPVPAGGSQASPTA